MEDANKIEEQMIEDINNNCSETTEENVIVEDEKDEEFVEVVGDADEVINEKEEEVK